MCVQKNFVSFSTILDQYKDIKCRIDTHVNVKNRLTRGNVLFWDFSGNVMKSFSSVRVQTQKKNGV